MDTSLEHNAEGRKEPTLLSQPLIMGIVNVTPDSFSDGGQFESAADAIDHAKQLVDEGADIIDIGGESTRPGHTPIEPEEEIARIQWIVEELADQGICLSVDTRHDETADLVIEAGATFINRIFHLYNTDGEIVAVDPGFGFVETYEQDLALWASLPELVASQYPVMVGISRKRLVGRISGVHDPLKRDEASSQLAVGAAAHGARILRVHNVALTRQHLDAFAQAEPAITYVALGSNLGDRHAYIDAAIERVDALPATRVVARSSVIETAAQYVTDQPDFLNGAIRVETKLPLFAFFIELQAIEVALGRVKLYDKGPRIIDLDLLRYSDIAYSTPELTIPHPLMNEREFVLRPLAEITV
ncbi:MAG: 2-amino-4-hydroxy-6-hydroxymethyldihydropteridine diphosphokinase [Coriobacteriia bacterium]|nr:2-amino-4-hydroxy-6-hydroxymethyldihydropteridine diphosphokinase [Coriobacteriia bacterium]